MATAEQIKANRKYIKKMKGKRIPVRPASVTSQGDAARKRARQLEQSAKTQTGEKKADTMAKAQAEREQAAQVQTVEQKRFDESFKAESEHAVKSSRTTASSQAIKEQEQRAKAQKEVSENTAEYDPKTGGIIYKRKLGDSVNVSDSTQAEGGGRTVKVKVSDSVNISEPAPEGKAGGITIKPPAEDIEKINYTARVGGQSVEAEFILKDKPKIEGEKTYNIYPWQKTTDQDPIPPYRFGEAALNVLKEQALVLLQPRPIISDILGSDPDLYQRTIERSEKTISMSGPTLLSSSIEQGLGGQIPSGTGRGLAYDIESGIAEGLLLAAPLKKIPLFKLSKLPLEIEAESGLKNVKYLLKWIEKKGIDDKTLETKVFKNYDELIAAKTELRTKPNVEGVEVSAIVTPVKQLQFLNKPLITKINEKYGLGAAKKQIAGSGIYEKYSPTGRGQEIPSLKTPQREIVTSEESLRELEKSGRLLERDVPTIKESKAVIEALDFAERKIKRKDLTLPKQVSGALKTEAEHKALVEGVLPELKASKGSIVLKTAVKEELEIKDVDIDYYSAFKSAKKDIAKSESIISESMEYPRAAEIHGTKLSVGTKLKESDQLTDKDKLIEILTKKDETDYGISSKITDMTQVSGKPILRRIEKVKTPEGATTKQISLESQTKRMLKDFLSIQGPRTEKIGGGSVEHLKPKAELKETSEGFRLGSPEHRTKTPSRLPITLEKIASDLETQKPRGYEEKAATLKEFAKNLRERYSEIEFEEIGKPSAKSLERDVIEVSDEKPYSSIGAVKEKIDIPSGAAGLSVGKIKESAIKTKESKNEITSQKKVSEVKTSKPEISKPEISKPSEVKISKPEISKPSRPNVSGPSKAGLGRSVGSIGSEASKSGSGPSRPSGPSASGPSGSGPSGPSGASHKGSSVLASAVSVRKIKRATVTERKPKGIPINIKSTRRKPKPNIIPPRKEFIGSSHLTKVEGFRTIESDISYVKAEQKARKNIKQATKEVKIKFKQPKIKLKW